MEQGIMSNSLKKSKKPRNSMIRKTLAWFIKPGKEPTNENILKDALKNYLNKADLIGVDGYGLGLCVYLVDSIKQYLNVHINYYKDIKLYIPLYDVSYAISSFKGKDGAYWWSVKDWWHRYRFMKWLIKQYKE